MHHTTNRHPNHYTSGEIGTFGYKHFGVINNNYNIILESKQSKDFWQSLSQELKLIRKKEEFI